MGHVRLPMHRFRMLSLLQETVSETALPLSVIQLPYRANDTWLGTEFKTGTNIFHDTLSLIQCLPQGFSPAAEQCGLRIDEWVESFPKSEEMTGISFNYDQPNSMPLQSLLLRDPRRPAAATGSGPISFASSGIRSKSAKLRAVEPDMIDKVPGLTTLLPATMAEFSTTQHAISLDYSFNVYSVIDKAIANGFAGRNHREIAMPQLSDIMINAVKIGPDLLDEAFRVPTITAYNRLEPRPRTEDFSPQSQGRGPRSALVHHAAVANGRARFRGCGFSDRCAPDDAPPAGRSVCFKRQYSPRL